MQGTSLTLGASKVYEKRGYMSVGIGNGEHDSVTALRTKAFEPLPWSS